MLALEISPQAEKGKLQGNIKPLSLVASPTGQERALSGLSRYRSSKGEITNKETLILG